MTTRISSKAPLLEVAIIIGTMLTISCEQRSTPSDVASTPAAPAGDGTSPPAAPADDATASPPSLPLERLQLPSRVLLEGTLYQGYASKTPPPGCGNNDETLETCSAKGELNYDWPNRTMTSRFEPCLPLLSFASGSDDACEYHFVPSTNTIDPGNGDAVEVPTNDFYYIYSQQVMLDPSTEPNADTSCCVVRDLSMISPKFPSYVAQCNAASGVEPTLVRMFGNLLVWLYTPGAGSYEYFQDIELDSGGQSLKFPNGFTGGTPDAFSQMVYTDANLDPGVAPGSGIPEVCQSSSPVPDCRNCFPCPPGGDCDGQAFVCGRTLQEVYADFKQPKTGGCLLCHTNQDADVYPAEEMPTCETPGQAFAGAHEQIRRPH